MLVDKLLLRNTIKKKETKTNHKEGWHKRVNNPTMNYPPDSHKVFCKRCWKINGLCPMTGAVVKALDCSV